MAVERAGFLIEGSFDAAGIVKGAGDAGESLKGVAGATKQLNTELETGKDGLVEHGNKLEEVGKKAGHGGEGFKVFGHGAHEAHAALRTLNEAIPGFEQMARFLSNGLTATMGIGALAIGKMKEGIDELNKTMDELESSPSARGEWVDELREKLRESEVELSVFLDRIQRIRTAEQTLEELTARSITQSRERIAAENDISRAQSELAEARLQAQIKLGQITPEQAIKVRLEIDDAAFKQQLEVKIAEIQAELNARTNEQGNNNLLLPQKADAVTSAKAGADAADAAKIKNEGRLKQDKENFQKAVEDQNKAQEIVDRLEGSGPWGGNWDKTDHQYYELAQAKKNVEANSRIQGNLKTSIANEEGRKGGLETDAATAKASYEEAKSKYEEAEKLQRDLNIKLANLAQDLTAEKAKSAALESLHHQTGAVRGGLTPPLPPPGSQHSVGPPAAPAGNREADALQTQINQAEKTMAFAEKQVASGNHGYDNALAQSVLKLKDLMTRLMNLAENTQDRQGEMGQDVGRIMDSFKEIDDRLSALETDHKSTRMRQDYNRPY